MKRIVFSMLFIATACLSVVGCGGGDDSGSNTDPKGTPVAKPDDAAAAHTSPYGGHLIELGNSHNIHADLKDDHDMGGTVVRFMDGDMKPMKIAQDSVTLVLNKGDEQKEFVLIGKDGNPTDTFISADEALHNMMHGEGVTGKLRVTIKGTQYNGKVDLSDHSGHDH